MFTTASAPGPPPPAPCALGGQGAGLVHHVGVGFQFAAHQGLKGLSDVAADVLALDGGAFTRPRGSSSLPGM